jgi:hypothetical protein
LRSGEGAAKSDATSISGMATASVLAITHILGRALPGS